MYICLYAFYLMLRDKFGREINYLRLAVVDRCNLRCTYCMPENGLTWIKQQELMTDEEMIRICSVFTVLGIDKIRITGGEPFVRKNCIEFIEKIAQLDGLNDLSITTNGLLTDQYIPRLKASGIKSVNLSLDTLNPERFYTITRRKSFDKVMKTLDSLLEHQIRVKINAVVMEDQNIEDIISLVTLTKELPVDVRFIEEMPFNGTNTSVSLKWDYKQIYEHIKTYFPDIIKTEDPKSSTSYNYKIPGFVGSIGIIAAYTRSFCGDCNRIRITPTGELRTCLYEEKGINLKEALRAGKTDQELKDIIINSIQHKPKDGWEAEKLNHSSSQVHQSMATIGG
ncbi:cyclic pyranopterin monophosphate synthase subunit MoaA [Elizabethkingia sp. YR214]|uniref:GTP 3',8-cyclase MoaA n=1 Tax=Elizabethkingia sp. YR214 TaxID=2135667 RepID=UPI000D4E901D|nr:GTP 3',8-cyclase MoaA [Elizabethkingia sp. YR214]PUB34730.1 cyclic pyranopterin monophosphate synthase subunit MoaA [Elizabethkingia sp. YR214]